MCYTNKQYYLATSHRAPLMKSVICINNWVSRFRWLYPLSDYLGLLPEKGIVGWVDVDKEWAYVSSSLAQEGLHC